MDRTTERAAQRVLADLVQDGGGTYEAKTFLPFKPATGFAVGIGGLHLPVASVTAEVVVWASKAAAGEYETSFFGTWLKDGAVYFDAVRYFAGDQRRDALLAGYQAGQEAIYDFGMADVITLGEEPIE